MLAPWRSPTLNRPPPPTQQPEQPTRAQVHLSRRVGDPLERAARGGGVVRPLLMAGVACSVGAQCVGACVIAEWMSRGEEGAAGEWQDQGERVGSSSGSRGHPSPQPTPCLQYPRSHCTTSSAGGGAPVSTHSLRGGDAVGWVGVGGGGGTRAPHQARADVHALESGCSNTHHPPAGALTCCAASARLRCRYWSWRRRAGRRARAGGATAASRGGGARGRRRPEWQRPAAHGCVREWVWV